MAARCAHNSPANGGLGDVYKRQQPVEFGPSVVENGDAGAEGCDAGKVQLGGDDLFLPAALRKHLAEWVDDTRKAAVNGAVAFAAGVAGDDKELVFDGAGGGERFPVVLPRRRPLGGQEDDLRPAQRQRAPQLGKAHLVADEKTAAHAVEREGDEMVAGGVDLVLAHGREGMGLVVFCKAGARAVEDAGGVVDVPAAFVRYAPCYDVDVQLARERGKARADGLCVLIARPGKVARGHEARVPRLGQHDGVGRGFPRGAADERLRAVKVFFSCERAHIHLDDADFHGGILQNDVFSIIRKSRKQCNKLQTRGRLTPPSRL